MHLIHTYIHTLRDVPHRAFQQQFTIIQFLKRTWTDRGKALQWHLWQPLFSSYPFNGLCMQLGVDFWEGENRRTRRKTLEARERSTTTTLFTWVPSLRFSTDGHPSSYWPRPTGLNLELSGERQRVNRVRHPCFSYLMVRNIGEMVNENLPKH